MFFYLSKVLGFLLMPSNFIATMLILSIVLWRTRAAKWAKRLTVVSAIALLICGLSPLGHLLILPLEQRFPAQDAKSMSEPTGIILLGGGISASISKARGQFVLNSAGDRIIEFLTLAKEYPSAKLVFSGGSAAIFRDKNAESDAWRDFYPRTGLAQDRLILEAKSRNTVENAKFTKELVKPKPGEKWIVVTSAYHMPRAVGCFRKIGFDVIPYPVDYRTEGWQHMTMPFAKISEGLRRVDTATREWIGLFAYWSTGKTSTLLPSP